MLEFEIEHELKGCRFWTDIEEFMSAARVATIEKITLEMDSLIAYRSRTSSREQLYSLIKTYKSYPEFRNKATLDAIYEGYEKNLPMDRPLVVESTSGDRRVFSGNSRMDAARHLGIDPEVLVVKSQTPFAL